MRNNLKIKGNSLIEILKLYKWIYNKVEVKLN